MASLTVLAYEWDSPRSYISFVQERSAAAQLVEDTLGVPREEVEEAWSNDPIEGQIAAVAAIQQVGSRWVYATSDENVGFDCSGLVRYAWGEAGVELSRDSRSQIRASHEAENLQTGDILWYPGHIMIYLGIDNLVVHSANNRTGVVLGRAARWSRQGRVLKNKLKSPDKFRGL